MLLFLRLLHKKKPPATRAITTRAAPTPIPAEAPALKPLSGFAVGDTMGSEVVLWVALLDGGLVLDEPEALVDDEDVVVLAGALVMLK